MADKKATKVKPLQELQALSADELIKKVAELRMQLVEQQRAHAAQELPSPAVIRKTRRTIAVALTLHAKKRAAAKAEPAVSEQPAQAAKESK